MEGNEAVAPNEPAGGSRSRGDAVAAVSVVAAAVAFTAFAVNEAVPDPYMDEVSCFVAVPNMGVPFRSATTYGGPVYAGRVPGREEHGVERCGVR